MKLRLTFLFLAIGTVCNAQSDTVRFYTDAKMKNVDAAHAVYKIKCYQQAADKFMLEISDKHDLPIKKEMYQDSALQIKNGSFVNYKWGKPSVEGNYLNNKYEGAFFYYNNGMLVRSANFKDHQLVGEVTEYDLNGRKSAVGKFENGKKQGEWQLFNERDIAYKIQLFDKGIIKKSYSLDDLGNQIKAEDWERYPKFPGGNQAFSDFVSKTLKYPADAKAQKLEGTVKVLFVVDVDGSVTDAKVKESISPSLDAEAKRIVELSPKWLPALQNGRPVKMAFSVPIKFSLSN